MKLHTFLLCAFIAITTPACTTTNPSAESAPPVKTTNSPEAFARTWLGLLDSLAPVQSYLRYLPDSDFEQWSYPEVEIKNTEQLKQFFEKTWGMIKTQTNEVTKLTVTPLAGGRFQIEIDVNWSATTANGQSLSRPLHYSLTVGPGTSSTDPTGTDLKVFKYKMTRP